MTVSSRACDRADTAARELRASMRKVLVASDAPYDTVRRIWNGAVDRRPALIVRCESHGDVMAAVRVARDHGLALSVRGGGYDWAGRALREDGLVLDLSAMRNVTIDPDTATAIAQGGATAGDVAAAARPFGLAPVTGAVRDVGMAGLTLAGGYGPLNGKYGLALDNLVGAEVVLADGRRVTASATDDADLYWALRGGGGGLGVVPTACYRLHPVSSVLAGLILFPLARASSILRGYGELVAEAPDDMTVMAGFFGGPDGQPLLFLFPTWSGDPREGEPMMARLQSLGPPAVAHVAPMPYENTLGMFDKHVVGGRHYVLRTRSLAELTEDSATMLVDAAARATSPFSGLAVHHFHGAAARVPSEATAFALRRDHLLVDIVAAWEPTGNHDDATVHERWADALSEQLAPHALPGGYPSLLGPDERARTLLAYGANAPRLLELKRRYDPDGVFDSATGALPSVPELPL